MAYSWLLFDADGTLFDFDTAEDKALRETFEQVGVCFKPEYIQTYHRVNAQVWKAFERGEITQIALRTRRFELLFEEHQIDPSHHGGVEAFSEGYLANLSLHGDLIDRAEEVTCQLSLKYKMAIITNGIASVQRSRYNRSLIKAYFPYLIISEEVGAAKPEISYFSAAFEQIGNPPKDQVLIIGDSLTSDMRGGCNFGVDTCWFNPTNLPPDPACPVSFQIRRLHELLEIL